MSELINKAKEYIGLSLSVIPTGEDKKPALSSWNVLQNNPITLGELETLLSKKAIRPDVKREVTKKDGTTFTARGIKIFKEIKGLAIITGAVSGNLEVIDVDTKQDETGTLWEDLRALLLDNLSELYPRLTIAQTRSGGYHIYYRCNQIDNNLKLSSKENGETLIETRGEGGYVIVPPTPGYKYLQGDPVSIPTITLEERSIILSTCRSFDNKKPEPQITTSQSYQRYEGLSPFEDYNLRGDAVGLLQVHGWKVVGQKGPNIELLRPGKTDSKTSGSFNTRLRVLHIFSTSTYFSPDKGYNPSTIFSTLECNGDNKTAYKKLLELGYGEPPIKDSPIREVKTEKIRVNMINQVNGETSVISSPGDTFKIENIQEITGGSILITSPGGDASNEVLKAIEIAEASGKRVYIKEGGAPEVRSYSYKLDRIVTKYTAIQESQGGELRDPDIDGFKDECMAVCINIADPLDKDIYKKKFLGYGSDLGITRESLDIVEEMLTSTREKEKQNREIKTMLDKALEIQSKGNPGEVTKHLESELKKVKTTSGRELLPSIMSFAGIMDEIATLPEAKRTGYPSLDKFVGFTPGAITLIAGRPSHGKTTLLYNFLLEMAQSNDYKKERFYFFTYEEPLKNISVKLLNRLTGFDLSQYFREYKHLAKPTNYEFLKAYIKDKRTDIRAIEDGKTILKNHIDSRRITVIDRNYSVEELYSLISYLRKTEPIGAIFIDYIQRMRTDRKTQDKRTEIAHISDQVLQIAKDSGLPIILGAQLNRATKKPTLENLKEAGNLEEDANTVISVYNQSRENEETAEGGSYQGLREVELEIKALKNREGDVNRTTSLGFDKWTGVIKDGKTNGQPF